MPRQSVIVLHRQAGEEDPQKEIKVRLEAALRKLQISRPEDPSLLSYESLIAAIVDRLALMPNRIRKTASRRELQTSLNALKRHAEELRDDIGAMVLLPMDWRVPVLMLAEQTIPKIPQGSGGAPVKNIGRVIAREVGQHFFGLTGKRPTVKTPYGGGEVQGPFVDLLREVYAILGIEDSPASQAKMACRHIRQAMEKIPHS